MEKLTEETSSTAFVQGESSRSARDANLRKVYAEKALSQIPRLLGLQDRNPFSPTYGCFHRDYWLDKTSDFPDAVRQFGVQALALVYKYDFPGNIYRGQSKVRDWAVAGLEFWASIQHEDGSFDEFYPYERGWAGPSSFTTYTSTEAFRILKEEIPDEVGQRVLRAIRRAAFFITAGESEEDHLANHHAIASLAAWKAYELLGDEELRAGFERLWQGFLRYHNSEEGWSVEYDGVDPGYLSATVSFLAKIYKTNPRADIFEVLRQSVEFCGYFVYPNGFYAGSMGSRNTLHFYPHGFEILADKIPIAATIAERLLKSISEGKLVPPEVISDRYVFYRVPEYLQAYLAYQDPGNTLPLLSYERPPFYRYFPGSRIYVSNTEDFYTVANLAKGGVVKVFDRQNGRLLLNDCGLIGRLADGRAVTSQWIDQKYECQADEHGWEVKGNLQGVPSYKLFTPFKNLLFRAALVALGWSPRFSHWLKGAIRKSLMLGSRPVPIRFRRRFQENGSKLELLDELKIETSVRFESLSVGDEFFVRYVPQSRYFQTQELNIHGQKLTPTATEALNSGQQFIIRREVISSEVGTQTNCSTAVTPQKEQKSKPPGQKLSPGVYDVDYYLGRQKKRQLIYRLRRRTGEVEAALRRHVNGDLRTVVDVGTSDGLMLEALQKRLGSVQLLGIDLSLPLLQARSADGIFKAQGDALILPMKSGVADAVVATAVIEHVSEPETMLRECARVLRLGGLLIITTPDPLMEHLASAVGLLKESGHQYTFKLAELVRLVQGHGFEVLEARKFMFSPVGFPAEKAIERILLRLGLRFLMANQLLVARKALA